MNTLHNPGPWIIIDDLEATLNNEVPGRTEPVIEIGNRDEGHTACYATNICDAKLICAAPELLAACVEALSLFDNHPECYEEIGTLEVLKQAIAKATGGAA